MNSLDDLPSEESIAFTVLVPVDIQQMGRVHMVVV